MKREGCANFMVPQKFLDNVKERCKCNYNVILYTNKTIKHPFAHGGKSRSLCKICTQPEKSGKYKRKQFKHELNCFLKDFDIC